MNKQEWCGVVETSEYSVFPIRTKNDVQVSWERDKICKVTVRGTNVFTPADSASVRETTRCGWRCLFY